MSIIVEPLSPTHREAVASPSVAIPKHREASITMPYGKIQALARFCYLLITGPF